MKNLVNLTPHDINLFAPDGATLLRTIPASGMVARVSSTPGAAQTVDGIPVPVVGARVGAGRGAARPRREHDVRRVPRGRGAARGGWPRRRSPARHGAGGRPRAGGRWPPKGPD